jgi:hypothetical protein
MKVELTQEQKDYRMDDWTLNRQLIHWLEKSRCVIWNLKDANNQYEKLREENDHATAMQKLIKKMFELGIKDTKYESGISSN